VNGFRFYAEHEELLQGKKVVVFSSSLRAPIHAFLYDLPMYVKGGLVRSVEERVIEDLNGFRYNRTLEGIDKRFFAKNGVEDINDLNFPLQVDLSGYEHGHVKEFVQRYLVP
jgi:hypothetical protein